MLEHDPASGRTVVEVLRSFGAPVVVDRFQHRAPTGAVRVVELGPTVLRPGERLTLRLPA
jgi:hypothetical protein